MLVAWEIILITPTFISITLHMIQELGTQSV